MGAMAIVMFIGITLLAGGAAGQGRPERQPVR